VLLSSIPLSQERVSELTASVARKDGHIKELRLRIEVLAKECDEHRSQDEAVDKIRQQLKKTKVGLPAFDLIVGCLSVLPSF
jgi:hypothetical protein